MKPPEKNGDRDMAGRLGLERQSGWDLLGDAADSAAAESLHVGGRTNNLAPGEQLAEYHVGLVVVGDPQLGRDNPAIHWIEIGVGSRVSLAVDLPRVGQVRHLDYLEPAPGRVGRGFEPLAVLAR